jgi:hypothetical protein
VTQRVGAIPSVSRPSSRAVRRVPSSTSKPKPFDPRRAVADLLQRRTELTTREEVDVWRTEWRMACDLLARAGEPGVTPSTIPPATTWLDPGVLSWTQDGAIYSATGPMGHSAAIIQADSGCSWALTDPMGRTVATGQHTWLSEAKRQVARACPGVTR